MKPQSFVCVLSRPAPCRRAGSSLCIQIRAPAKRACRRLFQVGWAQCVLAGSLAPRCLGRGVGHRPLQEAQGQHLPGPGLVLVLGRPVTDGTPRNGGYRQGCHRPFCGALLLAASVAINEEFTVCCFGGGLGVSICSFGEPLSRLACAEWVGPPRLAGWESPSPDSPKAVPLEEAKFRSLQFSRHILGASKSLTRAGQWLPCCDKFVHSLTVCIPCKQTPASYPN